MSYPMGQVSTTADTPRCGFLRVRLRKNGEQWIADDDIGLRYGHGDTAILAIADWNKDIVGLLETVATHECGAALRDEAARYTRALAIK